MPTCAGSGVAALAWHQMAKSFQSLAYASLVAGAFSASA
jgi:hypothetical protein